MTKKQLVELWNSLDDDTEIEQKAKRYDIAVELAAKFKKEYLNYKELNVHKGVIKAFNNIFPELKKSENEVKQNK